MLIILREFELNTLHRRRDRVDWQDLTKARVVSNSLQFNENEVGNALKLAVGNDQLLYLDLRLLPDKVRLDESKPDAADGLPELVIPEADSFAYREQPTMKGLKTYRLDYILSRESRTAKQPHETVIDGKLTVVHPAQEFERIESSLECEAAELRQAVKLLASPANGFLSWLRITLHDDVLSGHRMQGAQHRLDFAEPSGQRSRDELPIHRR